MYMQQGYPGTPSSCPMRERIVAKQGLRCHLTLHVVAANLFADRGYSGVGLDHRLSYHCG